MSRKGARKPVSVALTLHDRLDRLHDKWFLREPALLMVITSHELLADPLIHTIRSGRGHIQYNPSYMDGLNDEALENTLKAEAIRILLRHPYRYPPRNAEVSYKASNITLNEYYEGLGLPYRARDFWTDSAHSRCHFEFYYDELLQLTQQQSLAQSAQSSKTSSGHDSQSTANERASSNANANNDADDAESIASSDGPSSAANGGEIAANTPNAAANGDSASSNTIHDVESEIAAENAALWQEDDFMDMKVGELIQYLHSNSDQWGSIKGSLKESILATLKVEIDYRKILSGFRKSIISSDRFLTRFRPSRRYGFQYMGKKTGFTTHLLVGVDTSGSISSKELRVFFSTINRFFRYGIEEVDVQLFDAELQGEPLTMEKAQTSVRIVGRGGTSFAPILAMLKDNTRIYDGLVIFTDGYADKPLVSPSLARKIVWIVNNKSNYERHRQWMESRGRCCYIKA
ncbi:hypothetical protein FACS1894184_19420 [Clostridia bacterium]|nr:hypothetical protein FACS1894184_19420 [Clostridia bacterium]